MSSPLAQTEDQENASQVVYRVEDTEVPSVPDEVTGKDGVTTLFNQIPQHIPLGKILTNVVNNLEFDCMQNAPNGGSTGGHLGRSSGLSGGTEIRKTFSDSLTDLHDIVNIGDNQQSPGGSKHHGGGRGRKASTQGDASLRAKKVWRKEFESTHSIGFLSDAFWYVVCRYFKSGEHALMEETLYSRMAMHYTLLFNSIPQNRKTAFFKRYPDAVAQALLFCLFLAYPKSRTLFTKDFRRDLSALFHYWAGGLFPETTETKHWRLNLGGGDVLAAQSQTSAHTSVNPNTSISVAAAAALNRGQGMPMSPGGPAGSRSPMHHHQSQMLTVQPVQRRQTLVNLISSPSVRLAKGGGAIAAASQTRGGDGASPQPEGSPSGSGPGFGLGQGSQAPFSPPASSSAKSPGGVRGRSQSMASVSSQAERVRVDDEFLKGSPAERLAADNMRHFLQTSLSHQLRERHELFVKQQKRQEAIRRTRPKSQPPNAQTLPFVKGGMSKPLSRRIERMKQEAAKNREKEKEGGVGIPPGTFRMTAQDFNASLREDPVGSLSLQIGNQRDTKSSNQARNSIPGMSGRAGRGEENQNNFLLKQTDPLSQQQGELNAVRVSDSPSHAVDESADPDNILTDLPERAPQEKPFDVLKTLLPEDMAEKFRRAELGTFRPCRPVRVLRCSPLITEYIESQGCQSSHGLVKPSRAMMTLAAHRSLMVDKKFERLVNRAERTVAMTTEQLQKHHEQSELDRFHIARNRKQYRRKAAQLEERRQDALRMDPQGNANYLAAVRLLQQQQHT
uniref:Uncharacterized protein n=1 Tax=Chromera velia CCMP2878 TaxID=1169474 RepID=A0A0G4IBH0_9ALVE|eukprot:Cvel_12827.t1-p1 / transcript=Cvel_12827.t1 / gene=Cvel_12827 / organism=Chromera_velia_CCMP2878 / gene_product=Protein FAM227B, putative / transcript_product=Protein FAM227B, putative / location=Cvel_scaffold855:43823-47660(-) / protein_length=786 / sequence_SO=supercontig / SO=protein_coding / is_pseudo=false